ncbi:small EDRK-rich factor 2-like [Thomomys bottae]
MTNGNERELTHQKMKKQSDSVKGKRQDDGLSAAAHKQRDPKIMHQKQKKANEKKEENK